MGEYFLQGLIIGLSFFNAGLILIATLKRRRFPLTVTLVSSLLILLALSDALVRGSWWPLGTAITQGAVIVVVSYVNRVHGRVDRIKYEQEMQQKREDLERQVIEDELRRKKRL